MKSPLRPDRRQALLWLAALPLGAAGCGGQKTDPGAPVATGGGAPDRQFHLGCTIPTYGHPFFVAMKDGIEAEAASQGARLTMVDGKDDAQAQLNAIDTFIVQKVDAIILCPTESETLEPGVESANQAGIPVVTVNRTVAGGEVVTYVGADDRQGGRLQGEALIKARPAGAKIILLQGVIGSSPQRERQAGLEEALAGRSEFSIIQREPYKFQRTLAVNAMETLLSKYPKGSVDAIVAQSDDGALAAVDVCGQRGRDELIIIGFNGESDAFDAVKAGDMYATILQDARTQGLEAVKAALAHLNGGTVENPQITPLYTVTKENIDQYEPAWQSGS